MQDEGAIGSSIKGDIFQMPRNAFPTHRKILDNDIKTRKIRDRDTGDPYLLDIRSECPVRQSHEQVVSRKVV